jgi:putative oxidoreductase
MCLLDSYRAVTILALVTKENYNTEENQGRGQNCSHQEEEKPMNMAFWIAQGLLSLIFLGAGGMKVFAYEKFKQSAEKKYSPHGLGLSKGLITFIGVSELAGSLGLIVSMATGTYPALAAWAAIGLATIMLLATLFHLRHHESPLTPIALLALAVFVAVGRWHH